MALRPQTLALENLESRLNLSSLGGLAIPRKADAPFVREQATLGTQPRVVSLSEYMDAASGGPRTNFSGGTTTTTNTTAAPSNLTASVSNTAITLRWSYRTMAASGFNVYRSSDGTNFSLIGTAGKNKTTYVDTTGAMGVTYYYAVAAISNGTQSAPSNTVTATTAVIVAAPAAPGNFTGTAISQDAIALSWKDQSANETNYHIYRSTDGTNFTLVGDLAANSTSFMDAGLNAGTSYWYTVAAWNSAGETFVANAISVSTMQAMVPPPSNPVVTAPSAPASVAISTVTSSSLTVNWADTATNEDGYHVYRSTDGVSFTKVADLAANATGLVDSGLSSSTTYYYQIAAFNSAGETAAAPASATTAAPAVAAPGAPTTVSLGNITTSGLTISWTSAANASGYHVYRSTDGVNFALVGDLSGSQLQFADSGLSSSTTYLYRLSAWNAGGETFADQMSATTQAAITVPNTPTSVSISAVTSSSVTLHWSDNSNNETGFRVYRSTDGLNFTKVADLAAGVTSYGDSGLSSTTSYSYKVSAWDSAGEAVSSIAAVTTARVAPAAPASPSLSAITSSAMTLHWTDASSNESGFRVYRSTDGASYTQVADLAAGVTTFADSGLAATTTYYYKVSSWNSAGETFAGAVSAATGAVAPVAPGTLAFSNVSASGLTINWADNSSNESGFRVYRSTDGSNYTLISSLAAGATSLTDVGLAASTTYYYKVSSWNSGGRDV